MSGLHWPGSRGGRRTLVGGGVMSLSPSSGGDDAPPLPPPVNLFVKVDGWRAESRKRGEVKRKRQRAKRATTGSRRCRRVGMSMAFLAFLASGACFYRRLAGRRLVMSDGMRVRIDARERRGIGWRGSSGARNPVVSCLVAWCSDRGLVAVSGGVEDFEETKKRLRAGDTRSKRRGESW